MKKKDIQLTYVMIRMGCIAAIMNSTASVRVSLITSSLLLVIGVVSNHLKLRHLYCSVACFINRIKEVKILFQSDESSQNLQIDLDQCQQVRNQLLMIKAYLLEVLMIR